MDGDSWIVVACYVAGVVFVVLIPFALYCRIRYGYIWPKGGETNWSSLIVITVIFFCFRNGYHLLFGPPTPPPVVEQSAETQTEFGDYAADNPPRMTARTVPGGSNPAGKSFDFLVDDAADNPPRMTARTAPGGGSAKSIDFLNPRYNAWFWLTDLIDDFRRQFMETPTDLIDDFRRQFMSPPDETPPDEAPIPLEPNVDPK